MKSASTPDAILPPRVPNTFTLILRSVCVGIAAMVVALYLSGFIAMGIAIHSLPKPQSDSGGEVGWDLVTLFHNLSWYWLLLPAAAFTAGFVFGFRYFSRARS